MSRTLTAAAFLTLAIAMPAQDAAAQDALGSAIMGGAAGAIIGGALGGGKGAAVGAIIGGTTGAAIAGQGQPRPGGYRHYRNACYQERGDGTWIVVAPDYCGAPMAAPVEAAPPRQRVVRDELSDRMLQLRERCDEGERRACVRLGIITAKIASAAPLGGESIQMSSFTNGKAGTGRSQQSRPSLSSCAVNRCVMSHLLLRPESPT